LFYLWNTGDTKCIAGHVQLPKPDKPEPKRIVILTEGRNLGIFAMAKEIKIPLCVRNDKFLYFA